MRGELILGAFICMMLSLAGWALVLYIGAKIIKYAWGA